MWHFHQGKGTHRALRETLGDIPDFLGLGWGVAGSGSRPPRAAPANGQTPVCNWLFTACFLLPGPPPLPTARE